jgi:cytochrome c5
LVLWFGKKQQYRGGTWPHRDEKEGALRLSIFLAASIVLAFAAGAAQADDGQTIYTQHCAACHNKIPPKLGDKAAWAPRIKKGTDALVASATNGKGMMKPQTKAGLTPAQVKAAVEYMVEHSK